MRFFINTFKNFVINIFFMPKNIKTLLFFYKIKNNTTELEKSLDFQLIILGKKYFLEIVESNFDTSKVASLLEQEVSINKQLKKAKDDFTTRHIDNLTKEENLEDQIKGENNLVEEFIKKLNILKDEVRKFKKKIVQLKLTMTKNEMRKERVKKLKTFIPMHLIHQKQDSLAIKFKEAKISLRNKFQEYEQVSIRMREHSKQLDILKYEYKNISKKNKSLRNLHKQSLNNLRHQKNKILQSLDSEYLELGLSCLEVEESDLLKENDENCNYIANLKDQIYSNEERYAQYRLKIPEIKKGITSALIFYIVVIAAFIIGIFGF